LSDHSDGISHCASPYGFVAGCKPTVSVALSEDLEVWQWVGTGGEPWIDAVGFAEVQPQLPNGRGFFGPSWDNSGSDRCLDKAEVVTEIISGLGEHAIQGEGCG
jgi:hypothetical protein